uniref:Uncharacterized protein n=1 Tax=Oryza brachyantha TaxID=4533 RepID=J3MFM8_ORYBR
MAEIGRRTSELSSTAEIGRRTSEAAWPGELETKRMRHSGASEAQGGADPTRRRSPLGGSGVGPRRTTSGDVLPSTTAEGSWFCSSLFDKSCCDS